MSWKKHLYADVSQLAATVVGRLLPNVSTQLSSLSYTQFEQASFYSVINCDDTSSESSQQGLTNAALMGVSSSTWDSKSKKPCNCTKSQCLKLYCDCFATGEFCSNCNCNNCYNNVLHETERLKAIKACLDRNPEAFQPKIGKGRIGDIKPRHSKGCNCKRSGCLKNYCECYEAKIMCSSICKCIGCKNYEESPERTLMCMSGYNEIEGNEPGIQRTQQSEPTSSLQEPMFTADRLSFMCITMEVVQATTACLIAQAEETEKEDYSDATAEQMVIEEFGQCLSQILHSVFQVRDLNV
ncbi:protein lin-54 homolog [Protopterus annectens]|uniref:protein lin-54 homolog n=1 Tax=Protopterus annectens TaxID=7888 RepID=UPI001CF9FFE2|nr:protein lin-54 homolog [Protopterus annectens]